MDLDIRFVSFRENILELRGTIPEGLDIIRVALLGCMKDHKAKTYMMVCILKGKMRVNG